MKKNILIYSLIAGMLTGSAAMHMLSLEAHAANVVVSEASEKADEIIVEEETAVSLPAAPKIIISGADTNAQKPGPLKNDSADQSSDESEDSPDETADKTGAEDKTETESTAASGEDTKSDTAGAENAADNTGLAASAGTSDIDISASNPLDLTKVGTFGILQTEKYDNLDEEPQLSGGEARFLANLGSAAQQLSAVIKSSDGKVIVVDGGQQADEEHLISTVKEMGGSVDAWLITHPQTDHVGALYSILKNDRHDINIENIYYNFFDQSWYDANDPDECGMVSSLRAELEKQPESVLHGSMGKGDEVTLSENLSFKVLNSPVQSTGMFAGNSSGLMYDINVNGKHFIILGDMAAEVGDQLMKEGVLDGVQCDYVQISHHGQTGVSEEFYKKLNPEYCIWPTNSYIYTAGGVTKSGLGTTLTKMYISRLKVKCNYVTLGKDVIIR